MAGDAVLLGEVGAKNRLYAQRADCLYVGNDLGGAFGGIFRFHLVGSGSGIDQGVVENLAAGVAVDCLNVLGRGQVKALVGLGHEVANVDLGGRRSNDGLGDAADQQIWHKAGEKRTGADGDEVGVCNRVQSLRHGCDVAGDKTQLSDAALAGGNVGFTPDRGPVLHAGFQFDVRSGRGVNVPACEQNFGRQAHRFGEILRDGSERGQKQVAETVAFQARAAIKTMAEQFRKQSFVFAERYDAIANVARRQHVEFFAQPAARSSVVAYRNHRGKVLNERPMLGERRASRSHHILFESPQQRGEAGTPADGHNSQSFSRSGLGPGR